MLEIDIVRERVQRSAGGCRGIRSVRDEEDIQDKENQRRDVVRK